MTRREKVLATTLVILLVVLGGGMLFYIFVYEPISDVQARLQAARDLETKKKADLAAEEQQIKGVLRVNPRLSQWQLISLPPRDPSLKKPGVPLEEQKRKHMANMQVQYESYLNAMLRASGFTSVVITPRQPDRRTTLTTAKGKEPTYERMSFGVTGKGSKDGVVKMLEAFHKDPILHQVRTLSVGLPQNAQNASPSPEPTRGGFGGMGGFGRRSTTQESNLELTMTVEALLVAGAEERSTIKPPKIVYPPTVLSPGRSYAMLGKRNMFTGVAPEPEKTTEPVERVVTEDRADVLRFIKLTTLFYNPDRKRWEASIYDQAAGPVRIEEEDEEGNKTGQVSLKWEKQLNTRTLNELKIQDRYRNTILDAKVVHIDGQQLIFQADKQFFRLRCGDALHPAIEKPLSNNEVKELGLDE